MFGMDIEGMLGMLLPEMKKKGIVCYVAHVGKKENGEETLKVENLNYNIMMLSEFLNTELKENATLLEKLKTFKINYNAK